MAKIKSQLEAGKNVVITSGLVQELQDKGLSDIVDVRYTSRKAMVNQYAGGFGGPYDTGQNNRDVLIPIIEYVTNDAVPIGQGNRQRERLPDPAFGSLFQRDHFHSHGAGYL